MKPFTPQQVRVLQEIGDEELLVSTSLAVYAFYVGGHRQDGGRHVRVLWATFDSLVNRGALALVRPGSGRYVATNSAKKQLAEQLALPVCPKCGRQTRTQPSRDSDSAARFFVTHKGASRYFKCEGSNTEVRP